MAELDNKGQMFAGYRLLIGAIVALLILIIIVGAVNYLERLRGEISDQRLRAGIKNAIKQPNSDILVVEDIVLEQASYTQGALGGVGGIDGECVEIDAGDSSAFDLGSSTIEITQQVTTSIYLQCVTNVSGSCPTGCQVCCEFSFGKEI